MSHAKQKKLTAAANKLLRAANKKKPQKSVGEKPLLKVFTQTVGQFPPSLTPLVSLMKTDKDFEHRNRQLGSLEFLPNKTYYRAILKKEGVYFFKNLEIVMKKDFYFGPGISGFFYLTPDGKIDVLTEEEARQSVESQSIPPNAID